MCGKDEGPKVRSFVVQRGAQRHREHGARVFRINYRVDKPASRGYRASAHVANYYRTTKV